jgi:dihydroneopterin aldolase
VTGLLASVRDAREARLALAGGADLIDFKDPGWGALGALPAAELAAGVAAVAGGRPVSATIGDGPRSPRALAAAVRATAGAGVDYVKVGLAGSPAELAPALRALAPLAREGTPLVAVLFGDLAPSRRLIPRLRDTGFRGVMVDTAGKAAGPLPNHLPPGELARFLDPIRQAGMLTGLAGSLRGGDIPALLPLEPDFLGFRGALCGPNGRASSLDPAALAELRARIPAGRVPRSVF